MSNSNDDSNRFALDVTEATFAILRAAVGSTSGPTEALVALTSATAALQQYMMADNPAAEGLIERVNAAVEMLPPTMGRNLIACAIREAHGADEQAPTRFYGEA